MSTSSSKKIVVKSSDGETFEIDEKVALQSKTIKHIIEDKCDNAVIVLPKVKSDILSKVIQYCEKHAESSENNTQLHAADDDELKEFDAEFSRADRPDMFDIIEAAVYLNIEKLQDLMCQSAAMKYMPDKEIREYFEITNDFTHEEEAAIRQEHYWAYEGMDL